LLRSHPTSRVLMAATADAKQTAPESGLKVRYGEHPDQFVYVHLPPGEISSGILMNVIHGGFWKGCWTVQNTNSPQMLQAWLDKGCSPKSATLQEGPRIPMNFVLQGRSGAH